MFNEPLLLMTLRSFFYPMQALVTTGDDKAIFYSVFIIAETHNGNPKGPLRGKMFELLTSLER